MCVRVQGQHHGAQGPLVQLPVLVRKDVHQMRDEFPCDLVAVALVGTGLLFGFLFRLWLAELHAQESVITPVVVLFLENFFRLRMDGAFVGSL